MNAKTKVTGVFHFEYMHNISNIFHLIRTHSTVIETNRKAPLCYYTARTTHSVQIFTLVLEIQRINPCAVAGLEGCSLAAAFTPYFLG
jgi:hypothetical protein